MADFSQKLEGLLGNPVFNFGTGLLAASGPSATPVSLGQAIGQAGQYMSGRQRQQLQLQAARDEIKRRQDQDRARQELPAALNSTGVMKPGAVEGLLSQAYPQQYGHAVAQSLLTPANQPRLSSGMNDFIAATGMQPGSPNFIEEFTKFQQAQDPAAALQAQLTGLQIQETQNDIDDRNEEKRVEKVTLKQNTNQDLQSLKKLSEANDTLAEGFLATGQVLPDFRRSLTSVTAEIQDLFGADSAESRKMLAAFDTFKKESQRLVNNVGERYGANTNTRYQGIVNAVPNLGLDPVANRGVISTMVNDFLGGAGELGIDIRNPEQYQSLLSGDSRSSLSPNPSPSPSGDRTVIRFDAQGNLIQ